MSTAYAVSHALYSGSSLHVHFARAPKQRSRSNAPGAGCGGLMSMSDPDGAPRAPATDPDDTAGVGASAFAKHTKFFKKQHLFVEMDELRQKVERDRKSHRFDRVEQWVETHRWNFGLQEDLNEVGERVWNHPHLPWCSANGLVELQVSGPYPPVP